VEQPEKQRNPPRQPAPRKDCQWWLMPEKDTDLSPRRAAFLTIFPGAQPPAWNCVLDFREHGV
jgi:hypothetical protein